MTKQGTRSRTLLITGIAMALAAAAIIVTYVSSTEKNAQAEQATLLLDKGIAQFQQKQYRQSLDMLGEISEDEFQNWRVNYYMGSSLIMLRDYEPAVVHLEKALALQGEDANVLYALGVVYYKLGNLSLSKAYFGKVLEVDPDHDDARGLMDIVANLERQQLEGPTPESETESEDEAGSVH